MPEWFWNLLIASILDLIIGDPQSFPHPVRFIGKYIQFCEIRIRRILPTRDFLAGMICGVSTVLLTFFFVYLSLQMALHINKTFHTILEIYWIYTGLSAGDLHRSVERVYHSLCCGNINKARKNLSLIVGRDTENLDETEISRAAVETTAESFVDGILSPLFFFIIGGVPLMWAYKAVNTCDSMIGHNDERYHLFGKFSARLDDFANFAPARISVIFIFIASIFLRFIEGNAFHPIRSLKVCIRDGKKHASPNAGIPESAFAGALSVKLGGTNFYAGEKYITPFINTEGKPSSSEDIWNALKLMWASYLLCIFTLYILLQVIRNVLSQIN